MGARTAFSWLGYPNTASPHALSEKHLKFSLPTQPASILPPAHPAPAQQPRCQGVLGMALGDWGTAGNTTLALLLLTCPCGSVLSLRWLFPGWFRANQHRVCFIPAGSQPVTPCELSTHQEKLLSLSSGRSDWGEVLVPALGQPSLNFVNLVVKSQVFCVLGVPHHHANARACHSTCCSCWDPTAQHERAPPGSGCAVFYRSDYPVLPPAAL